jgi:hypothetical protein
MQAFLAGVWRFFLRFIFTAAWSLFVWPTRTAARGIRGGALFAAHIVLSAADSTALRLAEDYGRENDTLKKTIKQLKEDHQRETTCLSDEIAIKDRNIKLLTAVNARDFERVAAEIAMHSRKKQEASAPPTMQDSRPSVLFDA